MTTENVQRYPLSWPVGWKRAGFRKASDFHSTDSRRDETGRTWRQRKTLTLSDALERLLGELRRLGAQRVVISSNLAVRQDGLPYAQQPKNLPDPGVAVYFRLGGAPRVLACDKWISVAENMAAIAGHIAAIRTQERYGVGTLEQAFAGYAALPPTAEDWSIVLGVSRDSTAAQIQQAYLKLAQLHHPDKGGRAEDMARINQARALALAAIS